MMGWLFECLFKRKIDKIKDNNEHELLAKQEKLKKIAEELEQLKQMTTMLAGTRNLMFQIFDNCPDMLWAKNLEGRYIFANRALMRDFFKIQDNHMVLNRTDAEIIELLRKQYPTKRFDFISSCVNTDKIVLEKQHQKHFLIDGYMYDKYIALLAHKTPLYDENNRTIGVIGVGQKYTGHLLLFKKIKKILHSTKPILDSTFTCKQGHDCDKALKNIEHEMSKFIKSFYFAENRHRPDSWVCQLLENQEIFEYYPTE